MTGESKDVHDRRRRAMRGAVRAYVGQLRIDRGVALPAMLLPALGDVLAVYVPPLVVARVLRAYAGADGASVDLVSLAPFLVQFGLAWFGGEICWRIGMHFLARTDIRGMARLYVTGMDSLLAKDLSFFQDNFAGSLTKKVVAYSKSYEGFVDTLTFSIVSRLLPLAFVAVILGRFSPLLPLAMLAWILVTLALVAPLIRRRKKLVDAREEASNDVAGHVADSIANMEAVRAFAREPFEAEVHKENVRRYARKVLRSWDYQNHRIEMVTIADVRARQPDRRRPRHPCRRAAGCSASRASSSRSATTPAPPG